MSLFLDVSMFLFYFFTYQIMDIAKIGWAKGVPKRMWNSIPMSSHRFRKVSMDMACGRAMLAISTSHHPYLGALVDNVLSSEMYHRPSKRVKAAPLV